jgi:hypothetical protein
MTFAIVLSGLGMRQKTIGQRLRIVAGYRGRSGVNWLSFVAFAVGIGGKSKEVHHFPNVSQSHCLEFWVMF